MSELVSRWKKVKAELVELGAIVSAIPLALSSASDIGLENKSAAARRLLLNYDKTIDSFSVSISHSLGVNLNSAQVLLFVAWLFLAVVGGVILNRYKEPSRFFPWGSISAIFAALAIGTFGASDSVFLGTPYSGVLTALVFLSLAIFGTLYAGWQLSYGLPAGRPLTVAALALAPLFYIVAYLLASKYQHDLLPKLPGNAVETWLTLVLAVGYIPLILYIARTKNRGPAYAAILTISVALINYVDQL